MESIPPAQSARRAVQSAAGKGAIVTDTRYIDELMTIALTEDARFCAKCSDGLYSTLRGKTPAFLSYRNRGSRQRPALVRLFFNDHDVAFQGHGLGLRFLEMTDVVDRLPIGQARGRSGSPARDRLDGGRDGDEISEADIDREVVRSSVFRLAFPRHLETRYEADTKRARTRHISILITVGLLPYLLGALIDGAMFPDLGRIPVFVRFVMVPLVSFALWILPRVGATFRNGYVSFIVAVVIISPVAFIAASRGPLSAYSIIMVFLTVLIGSVMLRMQFAWTCLLAAVTAVSIGGMLFLRTDFPSTLTAFLWLNTFITCFYGMMISNMLERAERRSYLVTLREQVRSEQLSLEKKELSSLSLEDPLTGVANRRAFDARLADLVSQTGAPSFAMLMIDVDRFKLFNDHYGHPAGDVCLQRVAQALQDIVIRKQDLLARYGGEEYAVLLSACGTREAVALARRLCQSVADAAIPHVHQGDGARHVTVSIGVASMEALPATATWQDLVARADINLYAAKRFGRNRVVAGDVA